MTSQPSAVELGARAVVERAGVLALLDADAELAPLLAALEDWRDDLVVSRSAEEGLAHLTTRPPPAVVVADARLVAPGPLAEALGRAVSGGDTALLVTAREDEDPGLVEAAFALGALEVTRGAAWTGARLVRLRRVVGFVVRRAREVERLRSSVARLEARLAGEGEGAREGDLRRARLAVTHALGDGVTTEDGASAALDAVCLHLGWDVGNLWTPSEDGAELVCRASARPRDAGGERFAQASLARTFRAGEGLPGHVWATREPVWIVSLARDPDFPRLRPALEAGLESALAFPVLVNERFVGVVEFFTRRPEAPEPDVRELMATLAGALGQFLERGRAEAQLREQNAGAETLLRLSGLLFQQRSPERLVQLVTDEATRVCGAQLGAFFSRSAGDGDRLEAVAGAPRERLLDPRVASFATSLPGVEGVREGALDVDPPLGSCLSLPVVSGAGDVLGTLLVGHARSGAFTAGHRRLLRGVAGQAGVALDNALLHRRTEAAAERLGLALRAARLGDWSWDATTDVVTLSERAAEIFGIGPGPSMTWTAMQGLLHPEDRERARREVERVVAERVQYDIEYRVDRPDGRRVWVGALGRAAFDAQDRVVGMFGVVQDVTERRQLAESLASSEARFRSLMEQAPFSIQMLAPDGRTVRVNRAWEELWGLTLEQLGDYHLLADPQLEARGVTRLLRRAFAGEPARLPEIPYDVEQTLPGRTRHANPVRWVAAVAYPLKDAAGAVRDVVLVHEDVTARRAAEGALRASEERLRLAMDAGRMGAWDWDVRTGGLAWTESLEPLHGLAPGTFRGTFEHFQELIHPEDRASVNAAIEGALAAASAFYTEFRNLRPDGTVGWIAGSGKVFLADDGKPGRMIGVGLDVTARKRAERTARFLADASAALAVLVDADGTLRKVADLAVPHFADWVAVDVLEDGGALRRVAVAHVDPARVHLAHELHRRFPPDPAAPSGVWSVLRTGRAELVPVIDDDLLVRSAREPELLVILRQLGLRSYIAVPLVVRGRTTGVLTFIAAESGHSYDATDLAVAQDLSARAAIAIDNALLYRELRDADRRKDDFLATLAHELRNPLAPVRSGLDVVRGATGLAPEVQAAHAVMERQLTHLVRLVDDLLDLSRISRDKLELRLERVRLDAVVGAAVETSRPMIDKFGHVFTSTLPPEPLWLRADPVRLAQVFSNLLNNAAKYTPPGGQIDLTAEASPSELVVRVRDDGDGIPLEAQPRLFQPFAQVAPAGTRAEGGLGIGLMLVRRLTEMHGGTVAVTSEGSGQGSEFLVRLPRAAEQAQAPRDAEPARTAAGRRVLVVDDNQDAAEMMAMLLELLGHEAHVAHDGLAAIEAARTWRPDLVLLDIGMPALDGHETCRRIRAQPWSAGMVLVALTGWGQEEDRRRSREAGFDEHLVKPVDAEALAKVLGRPRRA